MKKFIRDKRKRGEFEHIAESIVRQSAESIVRQSSDPVVDLTVESIVVDLTVEPIVKKPKTTKSSMQQWLNKLLHSANCSKLDCSTKNCKRVKDVVYHTKSDTCPTNCIECTRRDNLLKAHSVGCHKQVCSVPKCGTYKQLNYIKLLNHTANCTNCSECTVNKCKQMERCLNHKKECSILNCFKCNQMEILILLHSKTCEDGTDCKVPNCNDIKKKKLFYIKLLSPLLVED